MIGETVPTFASSVDASLGQLTVHITNGFYYNEKPLVMHCWSEDDDLGEHTLWKDNEFHFSFRESFIGWTHFYCEMYHDKRFKKIDVYDSAKEYIKCTYTLNCYWMVSDRVKNINERISNSCTLFVLNTYNAHFCHLPGPQRSKGELQRFYEAYRSYGKDWKKVASQVCNRSVEMVDALYNMNRAFLSLPEGTGTGTASVVGLITMMTNDYNVMEGSDSERESNDAYVIPKKSQKRKRNIVDSSDKNEQSESRSLLNKSAMLCYTTEHHSVSAPYDNDVEHEAALTSTEGLQRVGSPQVSRTPYSSKLGKNDWSEGRIESKRPENGTYAGDTNSLMDMEGVGTVEVHRKGKKIYGKKMKVEEVRSNGNSSLDALQTLTDLFLIFPDSTVESESSVQLKEDKALDMDDKFSAPKSKLGRSFDIDAEAVTEVKEQLEPLNMWKRKRKPIMSKKLSNGEALILKSEGER
ncbi:hypothetical protein EZV62_006757 [Acer yangbiense]|uniref:Myb-like domain-containing protein n=1 Tax=Acer yangbiense TaxID=1000413 RepID=A0A5C7I9W5_9ROSI|nr:hypothetical protein EZV62_006757 [Acer yangbiense]